MERFRPLLPVGYEAGAAAYRAAAGELTARDLAEHYTGGLTFFHERFVPHLKEVIAVASGGAWDLTDFDAYAAGSDVDFMTHLVEAVAARDRVCLFPGDWFGFRVGATQWANIAWDASGRGELACLCVPSVRNGHLTPEMIGFLGAANALPVEFESLSDPASRRAPRCRTRLETPFGPGGPVHQLQQGVWIDGVAAWCLPGSPRPPVANAFRDAMELVHVFLQCVGSPGVHVARSTFAGIGRRAAPGVGARLARCATDCRRLRPAVITSSRSGRSESFRLCWPRSSATAWCACASSRPFREGSPSQNRAKAFKVK